MDSRQFHLRSHAASFVGGEYHGSALRVPHHMH
jgi:hypothetical protein